jgi:DNA segregation ATPase FtsK/SpoIIIE-like protein
MALFDESWDKELYLKAKEFIKENERCSTPILQRTFKISYPLAVALQDKLIKEKLLEKRSNVGNNIYFTVKQ